MLKFAPFGIVAILIYLIAALSIGMKKKAIPATRQVLLFVFFVYILAVVKITLFPIPLHHFGVNTQANNIIPFGTIRAVTSEKSLSNDLYNLGGNILLFVPFGFLLPLISTKQNRFLRIIVIGFCMTLVVESSQFIISSILGFTYRSFDVDDLILNTFGAVFGYVVLRLPSRFQYSHRLRSPRTLFMASPLLVLVIFGGLWGYEYESHSTPTRSLDSYDSNVLPLETIPFSKGVVLITATDPATSKEPGYVAWYFEKSKLWGWRLKLKSNDLINNENNSSKEVSFASMTVNGQTFVWGTTRKSDVQEIIYRYDGRAYTSHVGMSDFFWDITLPFVQPRLSSTDWTIQLRNGSIVPLLH